MFVIHSDLQGQNVNLKVFFIILFLTNTISSKCSIVLFHLILNGESIYGIILVIQGHFQDEKVNSIIKM